MSYPTDFDWKIYTELHDDLRHMNEKESKYHYLKYGRKEGRQYNDNRNIINSLPTHFNLVANSLPTNFDWKIYTELHDDLRHMNEKQAKYHYLKYGRKEGRQYSVIFKEIHEIEELNTSPLISYTLNNKFNSIIPYTSTENDTFIHCNNILYTRKLNHPIINYINLDSISTIKSFILIVDFQNGGGGTTIFLNRIISKYKNNQTFIIARTYNKLVHFIINDEYKLEKNYKLEDGIAFLKDNVNKIDKIFVNHVIGHSKKFIDSLFELGKSVSLITHDYISISTNPQPMYDRIITSPTDNSESIFHKYDTIITQNKQNLLLFDQYFQEKQTIVISSLPDYKNSNQLISTVNTANITIAIIGYISEIKGRQILEAIINYYKKTNENITFVVFGYVSIFQFNNYYIYNTIDEFNDLLIKHKPNVILEASLWPETYSYTLTMSMLTQLPIVYLKKNFHSVVEDRLKNYNKSYCFNTISEFDKLIHTVNQDYLYTIEPIIYFNSFWDSYFMKTKTKQISSNTEPKFGIQVYPIYFPQFHAFYENNKSFYPGYTDIENLYLLKMENKTIETATPSFSELNLNKIQDYVLTNENLVQKQIDIITDYNIPGFAIYYYWFSKNTMSNKHMLMENVVNIFFDNSIDMKNRKNFFIWANESWSNNPAFGDITEQLINEYDDNSIQKNIEKLIEFFIHDNYLKIENKPVFMLYHPWFMTKAEIDTFYTQLTTACIKNGFDGLHFIINAMDGEYINYTNFNLHFNYKKSKSVYNNDKLSQKLLDYKKYGNTELNLLNSAKIQTLVFDFDNRARLYKPNKMKYSTVCTNNTEFDKISFINKVSHSYNRDKSSAVENILLVNAWNEWGEKMMIEPSNEYGYYYLNLINTYLC